MEINPNKPFSENLGVRNGSLDATQASGVAPGAAHPPNHLTITRGAASPEDIVAAEISAAALSRSDALGRLIGEAFSLPPPPMPDFARAALSAT